MSKTKLFDLIRKLVTDTAQENNIQLPEERALTKISRRKFLQASALSTAALATSSMFPMALTAQDRDQKIAILGAGVAGLTAAYRLMKAGFRPVIYEASDRIGGRMYTKYDFNDSYQFCELGGEFVDTDHKDLIELANELGVGVEKLHTEGDGEDIYYFDGQYRSAEDMFNKITRNGSFVPIAEKIARDASQLLDSDGEWTDHAKVLDKISLKEYLHSLRHTAENWALELIEVAYIGEYGLDPEYQSCLNLVDLISTSRNDGFKIYGDSDEAYRIKGGSSALIKALLAKLEGYIEIHKEHKLTSISKLLNSEFELDIADGHSGITPKFNRVIIAIPFTKLREVKGLEGIGISADKLRSIKEMGYGTNMKIMYSTRDRVWREQSSFPKPSNGTFFTDMRFQTIWETSRGQQGDNGIITNYLGGFRGAQKPLTRSHQFLEDIEKMSLQMRRSIDDMSRTFMVWKRNKYVEGSYSCPKPGQYTSLIEVAGTPELKGRILFAGEHTSPDYLGFMNGAVQSANLAAKEVIGINSPDR